MKRPDRVLRAYNEFVRVVERERALPMEQRLMLALGAVLDLEGAGLDKDQLRALRERRVLEAVAERHGVTVEQITGGNRVPAFVVARDEAKAELVALGWNTVEVARAIGCSSQEVMRGVRRHEARVAGAAMRKVVTG
jgi:hypothetical protein